MDKPHKTWDFTVNNYGESDLKLLENWSSEVNRVVVSKEVGESGTPHLQGRITFKRTYRFAALHKMCPTWHWEVTMCPRDSLYIMKHDSDIIVNIDNRKQGHRTDLQEAVDVLKEQGIKEVAKQHPVSYVKYHKGLQALAIELKELPSDDEFMLLRYMRTLQ